MDEVSSEMNFRKPRRTCWNTVNTLFADLPFLTMLQIFFPFPFFSLTSISVLLYSTLFDLYGSTSCCRCFWFSDDRWKLHFRLFLCLFSFFLIFGSFPFSGIYIPRTKHHLRTLSLAANNFDFYRSFFFLPYTKDTVWHEEQGLSAGSSFSLVTDSS